MRCTFFWHRDTQGDIQPLLEVMLRDLIENKGVDSFYVGNHGNFDLIVIRTLDKLMSDYSHISYAVVLAYMPGRKENDRSVEYRFTIYPDGLENVPHKYAIIQRNLWMIKKSDYVVVYVRQNIGGAARFKEWAEREGKIVLNLYS